MDLPATGRAGAIKKIRGSNKLYVDIFIHGKRVVKSTGLDDTPENRSRVRAFLDKLVEHKRNGTLDFARAFPGASEEEKAYHAEMEGKEYTPSPADVVFRDYTARWKEAVLPTYGSVTKRQDFERDLDHRILPFFGSKTFKQITGVLLQQFVSGLVWESGKNRGKKLSRSRICNILIPLRAIWTDACGEYNWLLPNPFTAAKKHLPKKGKRREEIFRFPEWQAFLVEVPACYRPVVEVMVLTGMIGSELAGLRKADVTAECLVIQNSIVRGVESAELKTEYRQRKIPLTRAIRQRIEQAMASSPSDYVFVMADGSTFNYASFYKNVWVKAMERAGIGHRVAYIARHTFAAWALTVGLPPLKLVRLMGHGSKQMVYEVYGQYAEGLEEDEELILDYFGADFIARTKQKPLTTTGESSGESQGLYACN